MCEAFSKAKLVTINESSIPPPAEDEAVADGLDLASHGERAYDLT